MLRFEEFDLKTGQTLRERDWLSGEMRPRYKEVEHCYLEAWLNRYSLIDQAELFTAKFYQGVTEADCQYLAQEGKMLVFANGESGYFADPSTAQLLTIGGTLHPGSDRSGDPTQIVVPIYAPDRNSPHNLNAYGSLIASEGVAHTTIENVRILVIDDEQRSHGDGPLMDRFGRTISSEALSRLYDKMGDGTMLITPELMGQLVTAKEREQILQAAFARAGIAPELATIAQETAQLEPALQEGDRQLQNLIERRVSQFRAATSDLPGLIKGTMATSAWCKELGVAAIISKNDIKGDDGRLSAPGLKTVSDFWVNRKTDGQYGEQAIGPQVKGCIPHATLHEFNPMIGRKAQELEAIAASPSLLLRHYVETKEARRPQLDDDGLKETPIEADWLYAVAKADRYELLVQFEPVVSQLERFLRKQRIENAIRGIAVPSAMAQHHSQLRPWEVCNKDLPHGAIVAYLRSPFPNVGAAAIAINNTEQLQASDPEAYRKRGVAYLPPWTAKYIAITDFDRDNNAFFCGYVATAPDLPQQVRLALEPYQDSSPAAQYEAARALFAGLISQIEGNPQPPLQPAQFPIAVKEFIDRNAPDRRPPEIVKQAKVKHPWSDGESHTQALWRAWAITADNPTGFVANLGMTLQSLALEIDYIAEDKKPDLLLGIAAHYGKLLSRLEYGKFTVPSDEYLQSQGFPAYGLERYLNQVALVPQILNQIEDPAARAPIVQQNLTRVRDLLLSLVNGPIATNLQTAVDTPKSSRGIDEQIQAFAKALAHKPHLLRENQKRADIYRGGTALPTNTQEPIGWNVAACNQLYQQSRLPERSNRSFRSLFPAIASPTQKQQAKYISDSYQAERQKIQQMQSDERQRSSLQPSMILVTPKGTHLRINRLCDGNFSEQPAVMRARGVQTGWQITLELRPPDSRAPEAVQATLQIGESTAGLLGYVAPEQIEKLGLKGRIAQHGPYQFKDPQVQLEVPLAISNDIDWLKRSARIRRAETVAAIPEPERLAYAGAFWQDPNGMSTVLHLFMPELQQQLAQAPVVRVQGLQHPTNQAGIIPDGEYSMRFSRLSYQSAQGESRQSPSLAVVIDGEEKQLGTIDKDSLTLPVGTLARGLIHTEGSIATFTVQEVLEQAPSRQLVLELPVQAMDNQPQYTWGQLPDGIRPSYEVSTQGDARFSALNATLPNGRTIEHEYQFYVKGYIQHERVQAWLKQGLSFSDIFNDKSKRQVFKGRPLYIQAVDSLPERYKDLWRIWIAANPETFSDLAVRAAGKRLTDKFTITSQGPNVVSQARALAELLNEAHQIKQLAADLAQHPDPLIDQLLLRPIKQIPMLASYRERDELNQSWQALAVALQSLHQVRPDEAVEQINRTLSAANLATDAGDGLHIDAQQLAQFCQFEIQPSPTVSIHWAAAESTPTLLSGIEPKTPAPQSALEPPPQANAPQGGAIPSRTVVALDLLQPKPYNPIERVVPINERVAQHQLKDQAMGAAATQFIGYSAAPESVASSTRNYQTAWATLGRANTGCYTDKDVIMVSGSGPWRRSGDPRSDATIRDDIRSVFWNQVVPLLNQAIAARSEILVGDAAGSDQLVKGYLEKQGYRLQAESGYNRMSYSQQSLSQSEPQPQAVQITGRALPMNFPLKLHGERNSLSVDTTFEAMRGHGRCHTTRSYEPYAYHQFQAGDIALAYRESRQIAFRVGEQYRITPQMMADPGYQQRWAEMEKHSARELQSFQGKPAWGLHIEPLGDWINGQIAPFPPVQSRYYEQSAIDDLALAGLQRATAAPAYDLPFTSSAETGADPAIYHPSRSDLLEWLAVATAIGAIEQQESIRAMGLELRQLYNTQQGTTGETPPPDYRHPNVQVDEARREQMVRAVVSLQQAVSQLTDLPQPERSAEASI